MQSKKSISLLTNYQNSILSTKNLKKYLILFALLKVLQIVNVLILFWEENEKKAFLALKNVIFSVDGTVNLIIYPKTSQKMFSFMCIPNFLQILLAILLL